MHNIDSKTALKLGEMIKFYRQRANIKQEELDALCNLDLGTISKIESSQNIPTLHTVHKIAGALNLSAKDLSYMLGVNLYYPEI
jgi:transcriptional regulator with XRE-family HTH domain